MFTVVDHEELFWTLSPQVKTEMRLFIEGKGFVEDPQLTIKGIMPPNDTLISAFMEGAKTLSETSQVFVMLCYKYKEGEEVKPFAIYQNGVLQEYSRPPWRMGAAPDRFV